MIKTNHIDAVLFDLDGTILDTADDLGAALNYVLAQYDFPLIDANEYRPIASDGALGLLNLGFKEALANYDYDQLRAEFLAYYEQNIAQHTKIYDGLLDVINALTANNIAWGIITNKPIGLTNELLPHFPELKSSAITLGGDSLAKRKPDPLPMIHSCEKLSLDPTRCIYVGDAPRDIEAGNRANMTTVVAGWGYIKNLDDALNWGADHIAEKPHNLYQFIFESDRTNNKQRG